MEVTRSHPSLSTHRGSPLSSCGLQVGFTQPWLKSLCPGRAKNGFLQAPSPGEQQRGPSGVSQDRGDEPESSQNPPAVP